MKRISGRHGESQEYVEFQTRKGLPNYCAQLGSGGWWFVFECFPSKNGNVRTVHAYEQKEHAVIVAEVLCKEYERRYPA